MIKVRRIIERDMHSRKNNDARIQTMSLSNQPLFSLDPIKTDPRLHGGTPEYSQLCDLGVTLTVYSLYSLLSLKSE